LLAGFVQLVEHEMGVLERLPHAAFWGEIASDRLCAFGVHHLRGSSRYPRYFEERRWIETENDTLALADWEEGEDSIAPLAKLPHVLFFGSGD